jgi:hypothetical protein
LLPWLHTLSKEKEINEPNTPKNKFGNEKSVECNEGPAPVR